ncbi:MAG: hypothetical protein K5873_04160 [Treponema sp.]|nr:hypothetical protein [Treponema sp.]
MIEILVLMILLPLFSVIFAFNLSSLNDCRKRYEEIYRPYSRDKAIVQAFRKISGKIPVETEDFEDFLASYKALFNLDSISVVSMGIKDNKRLLKCSWTCGGKSLYALAITTYMNEK